MGPDVSDVANLVQGYLLLGSPYWRGGPYWLTDRFEAVIYILRRPGVYYEKRIFEFLPFRFIVETFRFVGYIRVLEELAGNLLYVEVSL